MLGSKGKAQGGFGKGGEDKSFKSTQNQPPAQAPPFAWTCTHCNSSVNLRHQWCWQCRQHWEELYHEPERERPGSTSGTMAKSGTDEKKNKQGPQILKLQQSLALLRRMEARAEGQASAQSEHAMTRLEQVLAVLRFERDSEKSDRQRTQALINKLTKAQRQSEQQAE